jgi:L,D-transpeptidase ErfK/SrfK
MSSWMPLKKRSNLLCSHLDKSEQSMIFCKRSLFFVTAFTLLCSLLSTMQANAALKARTTEKEETKPQIDAPYIGSMKTTKTRYEDTLLKVMRKHNLGYVEIRAANPDVDVWIPGAGTKVTLPTRHLLPDAPRKGIVINLSEMRLYSFIDVQNPQSFPIGVGRDGLNTPTGKTRITRKKDGPTWRPTPRMREENPDLPASVPPGDDNPLGTHALYLGWPQYLIHGTHRPWGIGRRVSSGCIRMYPEHITQLFEMVPTGTSVNVVKQPLKFAWIDEKLYLEAHAEDALADAIEAKGEIKEYDVPKSLFSQLRKSADEYYDHLDWDHIRNVVKERRGYPIEIFSVKDHLAQLEKDRLEQERLDQEEAEAAEQESYSKKLRRPKRLHREILKSRGFSAKAFQSVGLITNNYVQNENVKGSCRE